MTTNDTFFNKKMHYVMFDEIGHMPSSMTYLHTAIPLNISTIFHRCIMIGNYLYDQEKYQPDSLKHEHRHRISYDANNPNQWMSFDHSKSRISLSDLYREIIKLLQKKLYAIILDVIELNGLLPHHEEQENEEPEELRKAIFYSHFNGFRKSTNNRFPINSDIITTPKPPKTHSKRDLWDLSRPYTNHINSQKRKPSTLDINGHNTIPTTIDINGNNTTLNATVTEDNKLLMPDLEEHFAQLNKDIMGEIFYEFITAEEKNLEKLAKSPMKEFFFDNIQEQSQPRSKRFLGALAGGAVILGTFLGLYNSYEISKLTNNIHEMRDKTNLLVQVTNQHTQELRILHEEMYLLKVYVENLMRHRPEVIMETFNLIFDELREHIGKTMHAFQQLQNHRLSVDLVPHAQLVQMHHHLEELSKQHNLELLPTKTSDYFQIPVSYIRKSSNLLILMHVPCISTDGILTIYRYIPYPFPLPFQQNQGKSKTIAEVLQPSLSGQIKSEKVPHFPMALFIKAESEYLAIGSNHQYKLLSEAEFGLCEKRGKYYLCEGHQVLGMDLEDTCVGSLYLRSEMGMIRSCSFETKRLREMVYQVSETQYLIFTPTPFTARMVCRNGSHYPIFIQDQTEVRVDHGCTLNLNAHRVKVDESIRAKSVPLRVTWMWNPLDLPANLMSDVSLVDQRLNQIDQTLYHLERYRTNMTMIKPLAVLHGQHMYDWLWYTVLGIISLVAVLIIICCLWSFLKKKRISELWALSEYASVPTQNLRMSELQDHANDGTLGRHVTFTIRPETQTCRHGKVFGICCPLP